MIDIDDTIIRQYFTSPRMRRILENFRDNMDAAPFYEMILDRVIDPRTAVSWGLDVWGRIVGVSRYLDVGADKFIGFEEASDITTDTFGYAIWYNGFEPSGTALYLTDEMYRKLIFAKAMRNISDCSIYSINKCLKMLFPDSGLIFAQDNFDRTISIIMDFTPDPSQIAIITQADVIPIAAGVSLKYVVVRQPTEAELDNDFGGDIS